MFPVVAVTDVVVDVYVKAGDGRKDSNCIYNPNLNSFLSSPFRMLPSSAFVLGPILYYSAQLLGRSLVCLVVF